MIRSNLLLEILETRLNPSASTIKIVDDLNLIPATTEQNLYQAASYGLARISQQISWKGILDTEVRIRPASENPNPNANGLMPSIISVSWLNGSWSNDTLREMLTGVDPKPQEADAGMTIYLGTDGQIRNYGFLAWFDPEPVAYVPANVPAGCFDIIGVFCHEVFHGIGFLAASKEFSDLTTTINGNDFFIGPATQQVFGGKLPLAPRQGGWLQDHYGNTSLPGNTLSSGLMFQWGNYEGNRLDFGKLDLAVLQDLGISVTNTLGLPLVDTMDSKAPRNTLSKQNITENVSIGTTIGTLSTSAGASGFSFTLAEGGQDNGAFSIVDNVLKTKAPIDFEVKKSFSILVRNSDSNGIWTATPFVISVSDINEAPTAISLTKSTIPANPIPGTFIGTLSTTDPDAGNTFNYSLVAGFGGDDNDAFAINGSTLFVAENRNIKPKSSYSIRVRSIDQGQLFTDKVFTINGNSAPAITSPGSAAFIVNKAGNFTMEATGFPIPNFSVGDGKLPFGLSLSNSGIISGTPSNGSGGIYRLIMQAANGVGGNATQDFSLTVNEAPVITSANSTAFAVGSNGSFSILASGFPSPTFSILSGVLPSGVSLSATGLLSGTPANGTGGIYPITIKATNGVGAEATQTFNLTVNKVEEIKFSSSDQTIFVLGENGYFKFQASGNPIPTFSLISGILPNGVTLSSSGILSGNPGPSTTGTHLISVKAKNGVNGDAVQSFALIVGEPPAITSNNSITLTTGLATSFSATATGYPVPNFTLASGSLPVGVALSGAGLISGTPSPNTGGRYSVALKASNGINPDSMQNLSITVNQPPAIISEDRTTFTVGKAGAYPLVATGFPAPAFTISVGSLPPGLNLSSSGLLSGTPTGGSSGIYRFAVQAVNGVGNSAIQAFTVTVNQGLAITSPSKATFVSGEASNFSVTATGDPAPLFNIVSGVLPFGVSFTSSGVFTGTPQTGSGGFYPLVIRASNNIGLEISQNFTLIVNQKPVISTANKASFIVGKSEAQTLVANGFPAPTFSIESGTLPNGISLTSDGKLQGVALPGSMGSYNVQVKASNVAGNAIQNFTLAVNQEGVYSVAAMGGGSQFSNLVIYKNGNQEKLREVVPFPGFKGEFYTDHGDVNGDGIEDIIVGSGRGSQNGHVVVFDGAVLLNPNPGKPVELPYSQGGSVRASLYAFVGYSSGVAVRLADLNDDGVDDIVMAPGTGAGTRTHSHLRVWNGKDSMADFEAGKPLPYDYRWEMASFWAFGEGSNPGGGLSLSVIRQPGPDLVIASQLFKGGSKVFRYDGQKVLTTVTDLTGWPDLSMVGNTVVAYDRDGNRFFANGGTDFNAADNVYVRDKDKKAAYTIDRIFGNTPGGLRLGLANVDLDAEDELLVTRGNDSTTKVYDLFADKAVLIDTLKPGGNSGWV